jgi:hypothetical protein
MTHTHTFDLDESIENGTFFEEQIGGEKLDLSHRCKECLQEYEDFETREVCEVCNHKLH